MTDEQLKDIHIKIAEGQALQAKQIALITALLAQKLPDLTPEERKVLERSSRDNLASADTIMDAVIKLMNNRN
jgi:flagellar biosynthesis/type III secretory pathway M-ring protein FliF/YscJ